jgi:hypothetical protein
MIAAIVFTLLWGSFIGLVIWLIDKLDKMNDQLFARVKQLQSLHDYLEQPDVLMSIPQPHRLKISELLNGEVGK